MLRRYLFGPTSERFVEQNLHRQRQAGGCLAFDASGSAGLAIGAADTWEAVTARLPPDWRPDFVVLDLHYTTIPPCLWKAPVPLIGLAADWNLLWHGYRRLLHHVDLVLTDTAGVQRLAQEGIDHARAANLFGLERAWEELTTESIENTENRDIDILFVGNLHPAVQRERLPWLARIARLSQQRRVAILHGVQQEEYRKLLARSRIAFNRSIRGEANLRTFEAAAAGALLFQEAGNLEVPSYFRDRQECVYYTDDNLEELLEYYLDHEDERRAIAQAARERVAEYTFENLWDQHLTLIEQEWPAVEDRARQRCASGKMIDLPARLWQALGNSTKATDTTLVPDLATALVADPGSAELHNALGMALAVNGQGGPQAVAGYFSRAVQHDPKHVVAALNLVEALAASGQREQAIEHADLLSSCSSCSSWLSRMDAPHFPPGFDFFRVEWERAGWSHTGDRAAEAEAKRALLRWRLHHLLGELTGELRHYYEAVLSRPDLPTTRAALGCALARAGQAAAAVPHLRAAAEANPFDPNVARALYQALLECGDVAGQQELARERALLARAAPRSLPVEPWFAISADGHPSRNGELGFRLQPAKAGTPTRQSKCDEPLGIVWEGDQDEVHSLALVNREVCSRLRAHGHVVAATPSGHRDTGEAAAHTARLLEDGFQQALGRSADVHVRHQWPPRFVSPAAGHWVIMQHWEFGSLPLAWIEPLRRDVDEIWVASTWVRSCFVQSGISEERVQLVPLGVDSGRFHPGSQPLPLRTRKQFKFLFVGGTVRRKGIDVLLDVYTQTFARQDDVCLVIKDMGVGTFYQGMTAQERIAELQAQPGVPEIEYLDRTLTTEELAGLYTACDCLVHPYRGEGFGLPIAEAMGCALPVIVTGYGAALDFCSEQNAYLIPAQVVRFAQKKLDTEATVDYPWLAEPNREALAAWMRHVLDHRDESRAKGLAGRETIRTQFTWERTTAVVEGRLQALCGQPIGRLNACSRGSVVPGKNATDQELRAADHGLRTKVSVCLIVKNEERNLPHCLESVRGLADEIVVVDTGSTDRTKEIARQFGAKVFDFAWVKSFAAARNACLQHATGAWIFWLDADDRIDQENRRKLQALFAGLNGANAAYVMKCVCLPDPDTGTATAVEHVRLFRNHPQIRWEHRIHEQILPAVRRLGGEPRFVDVVIQHVGYQDPELRSRKRERDLELLLLEYAEQPEHPFTLFNLGMTYLDLKRPAEALPLLERSLARSDSADSIVRKLYYLIVQCHRQMGQPAEALAVCQRGRVCYAQDAELLSQEAQLRSKLGDPAGAEACYGQLLAGEEGPHFASVPLGLRGYLTRHNLAVLYHEQGRLAEAEAQWRAALDEQPEFVPAWLGLEELYVAQGRWVDLEQVARHFEADPKNGTVHLSSNGRYPVSDRQVQAAVIRAHGHLARKEFAAARKLLKQAIGADPRALRPRELLSHVLLQEDRDPVAAEEALRDILALDPAHAGATRNLEVFLRLHGRSINGQAGPPTNLRIG